ncbi:hypothetical protein Hanom_Chr08g00694051 [Helianthus anomalus]
MRICKCKSLLILFKNHLKKYPENEKKGNENGSTTWHLLKPNNATPANQFS